MSEYGFYVGSGLNYSTGFSLMQDGMDVGPRPSQLNEVPLFDSMSGWDILFFGVDKRLKELPVFVTAEFVVGHKWLKGTYSLPELDEEQKERFQSDFSMRFWDIGIAVRAYYMQNKDIVDIALGAFVQASLLYAPTKENSADNVRPGFAPDFGSVDNGYQPKPKERLGSTLSIGPSVRVSLSDDHGGLFIDAALRRLNYNDDTYNVRKADSAFLDSQNLDGYLGARLFLRF